jgi:hypothetical protein
MVVVLFVPHSRTCGAICGPVRHLARKCRSSREDQLQRPACCLRTRGFVARSVILPVTPRWGLCLGCRPNKRVIRAQSRERHGVIGGRVARMAAFSMVRRSSRRWPIGASLVWAAFRSTRAHLPIPRLRYAFDIGCLLVRTTLGHRSPLNVPIVTLLIQGLPAYFILHPQSCVSTSYQGTFAGSGCMTSFKSS